MGSTPRRSSLRDLRLASAASMLSGSHGTRTALAARRTSRLAGGVTYLTAPKETLRLADGKTRQSSFARPIRHVAEHREPRRVRKKREWLERVERLKNRPKGEGVKKDEQSCWAYLPDLVLEEIFKMLPFEVGMA